MRNVQILAEMRQKEEALRQSEERYRHLVDTIPVGVYTCDADGRITFFNQRAAELWGRSPRLGDEAEKFCGSFRIFRTDGSPVPHDRCPMAVAVREGRSFRDEEIMVERPDGSRGIASVTIDPIFDEAGNLAGAINAIADITERKGIEAEAARLAAIVDSSEDAIIGKTLDGTIISWNHAAERIYGYRAEEVIGRSVSILTPDGGDREFDEILRKIARSEVVQHYETLRRRKDGEVIHVSLSLSPIKDREGAIIGASTIARDITDLKRAEKVLREKERQYRDLVEALPEMAWFTRPDGYHEYLNGRSREFTGLSLDESHGDLWSTVLHPDDYERTLKRWHHSLETGEPYEIEYRFRKAEDGKYYWFLGRALPLRNRQGEIVRWFGTCSYIHDQKETEAALRTSERRFRLVVESSPFPSLIHAEDGEVVMVNSAWTRLSGYAKSDIPTMEDWTERAYGERKQQVKSYIDTLYGLQGMVAEGEFEVITAKGERRVWDFFSGPLGRDERGRRLVISTAADVTDRKHAEEALRKTHGELETRVRERTLELSLSNESLKAEMAARKRAEHELRLDEARFEALYRLSQMTDLPEREIIDFALEEQLRITQSAIGTLGLLNEDETIYTPYGWSKHTMAECAIHDKPQCLDVDKSGIWAQAVVQRKAMVVNDYSVFSPHKKGLPEGHVG
ncbi:MAG: PAS domain S-box protein, partial [Acidobacteriota bacterium]